MRKNRVPLALVSADTEHTSLLRVDNNSSDSNNKCASCGTAVCSCFSAISRPVFNFSKSFAYHAFDLTRIDLVTQSLIGRWLYQLFLELERYGWAPGNTVQQSWLGWPIIGAAFLLAVTMKVLNRFKETPTPPLAGSLPGASLGDAKDQIYLETKNYPARNDYLNALFSSSLLYLLLDAVSSTGSLGSVPLGWFIATSVAVPIASVVFAKLALPDTTDKLIFKPSQLGRCPTYPAAERKEKALNTITGAIYGANILVLFWTINREVHKQTAPLETWQLIVSGLYVVLTSVSGYQLTNHPKLFHGVAALSKSLRDGSLAYAALSGLVFHLMMGVKECVGEPCWAEDINSYLTYAFVPIAVGIGLFSASTTLFRYDEKHQSYLDNKEMLINAAAKVSDVISRGISGCAALFSRCPCKSSNTVGDAYDTDSENELAV